MNASLVKFPYADSDFDACRGTRTKRKIGVALLVEDGEKKVFGTERPHGVQFFELMGRHPDGRFHYNPTDSSAILPENEYEFVEKVVLSQEVLATMRDAVSLSQKIEEAQNVAMNIVKPARYKFEMD